MDKVGIPQGKVASHCAVPSLGPSLGGTGSTLSGLAALWVVSVCLKEVCLTPNVEDLDFLEPAKT